MSESNTEIGYRFVREKLLSKELSTEFINSNDPLTYNLTKSLRGPRVQYNKLKGDC